MIRAPILISAAALGLLGAPPQLRPPLWTDNDTKPISKPAKQDVSELYALLNNSWFRHLSVEQAARAAHDRGALNVNAWDGVPDSSWFTNRIGRKPMSFEQLLATLGGAPPQPGPWVVERNDLEGYTPKLHIKDGTGRAYVIKFDLPEFPERNSGAERISTLILAAAGYNVPSNFIVSFRPSDLRPAAEAMFVDRYGRERAMTEADLTDVVQGLKVDAGGNCRAMASLYVPGKSLGKFKYDGVRPDDANDIIPHELRRELRGLRVIASWINHADAGDKNTFDTFITQDGTTGFVRHYLLDFGSTFGSGNYVNGPYRIGHEYVFDGAAMGKTFFSMGAWRRPWEAKGRIAFPEIGYYAPELFQPAAWRPNYPNLAFVRMDDGDAYWGTRIVLSFADRLIDQMVAEARYSRSDVARCLADTLKSRREMIGRHWLREITPLDDFRVVESRVVFRDLAVDYGYAEPASDRYRYWLADAAGKPLSSAQACDASGCVIKNTLEADRPPDAFGRTLAGSMLLATRRGDGKWASPVEVVLGFDRGETRLGVLGWRHGAR